MRRFSIILFSSVLIVSLLTPQLRANENTDIKSTQSFRGSQEFDRKPDWYERFQPYEMNYAIWQFTSGDDAAMEVQYSLKYDLYREQQRNKRFYNLYLAYTGKFDFYMFTRYSSPVINRNSNPALHYRYTVNLESGNQYWLDFGIEHRSDGQVTDADAKDLNPASPTYGQYIAEIEYEKGNHEYFDGISRDANYVSFTSGWKRTAPVRGDSQQQYDRDKVEIEIKAYFSQDADITWGPDAGSGTQFSDYDIVNVHCVHTEQLHGTVVRDVTIGFDYVIGAKGLATDSIDLFLIVPLYSKTGAWKLPFAIKTHFGPMDRLSNYTQSMRSVGFGFALNY
jgi:hypothetical protein